MASEAKIQILMFTAILEQIEFDRLEHPKMFFICPIFYLLQDG